MKNEYRIEGDLCYIKLTRGQECVIDVEDMNKLRIHQWCSSSADNNRFYAATHIRINGKLKQKTMHRVLMGDPKGFPIDHINRDGLDNRRSNLRVASALLNSLNRESDRGATSKYLGVFWETYSGKWRARIHIDGKSKHVGRYKDEREAGICRARAFVSHYGEELNSGQTKLSKERIKNNYE